MSDDECDDFEPGGSHAEDDFEAMVDDDEGDGRMAVVEGGSPACDYDDDATRSDDADERDQDDEDGADKGSGKPSEETYTYVIEYDKKRFKVADSAIVRNHNRPIIKESGEAMSDMLRNATREKWGTIDPVTIVVVKGMLATSSTPQYIWYTRIVCDQKACTPEQHAHDFRKLTALPKPVVSATLKALDQDPEMQESTLLTTYHPFEHNSKCFDPKKNNWPVCDAASWPTAEKRAPKAQKRPAPENGASGAQAATKKSRMEVDEPQPVRRTGNAGRAKPKSSSAGRMQTAAPTMATETNSRCRSPGECASDASTSATATAPARKMASTVQNAGSEGTTTTASGNIKGPGTTAEPRGTQSVAPIFRRAPTAAPPAAAPPAAAPPVAAPPAAAPSPTASSCTAVKCPEPDTVPATVSLDGTQADVNPEVKVHWPTNGTQQGWKHYTIELQPGAAADTHVWITEKLIHIIAPHRCDQ